MEEFASTNSYREGTEAEEWRADGDKSVCSCVCKWNPELMVVVLDFDAVALGCVVQVFFFFCLNVCLFVLVRAVVCLMRAPQRG